VVDIYVVIPGLRHRAVHILVEPATSEITESAVSSDVPVATYTTTRPEKPKDKKCSGPRKIY
jgi:hypothetical protein